MSGSGERERPADIMLDASPRRRKVRYTVAGRTALFVAQSSSGLVVGLGDLAPPEARRFHLTSLIGEKGIDAHITDQRGEVPRVRVPKPSMSKLIRRLKRLAPFIHRARWNEVAWLPIGKMADRIAAINRPVKVGGREVIQLEGMRQRVRVDLWDPSHFRKVRVSELAQMGKVGFRNDGGVLKLVFASRDGAVLALPSRRAPGLIDLILEASGLGLGAYLAHLDSRWPETARRPAQPKGSVGQRRKQRSDRLT